MAASPQLAALVNPKERRYYALLVAVSLAAYAGLAASVVASAEAGSAIVGYGLMFALIVFMTRGLAMGRLRGNGIRVSARQFPALHRVAERHAAALGLERAPDVFVVESGGSSTRSPRASSAATSAASTPTCSPWPRSVARRPSASSSPTSSRTSAAGT